MDIESVLSKKTIKAIKELEKKYSNEKYNLKKELITSLGLNEVDNVEGWSILEVKDGASGESCSWENEDQLLIDGEFSLETQDDIIEHLENDFEMIEDDNEANKELFFERMKLIALSGAIRNYDMAIFDKKKEDLVEIFEEDGFINFEQEDTYFYVYNYERNLSLTIPVDNDYMFTISEYYLNEFKDD